jgi:hypothetical protein
MQHVVATSAVVLSRLCRLRCFPSMSWTALDGNDRITASVVTQSRSRWRCKARKRRDQSTESRRTRDTMAWRDSQERILAESSNTCRQQSGEPSPKTAREHKTNGNQATRLHARVAFLPSVSAGLEPNVCPTANTLHTCALLDFRTLVEASPPSSPRHWHIRSMSTPHRQIPHHTAQHHQTRPSVMPSLKRRGLGLSLGRGDLMDPLPTKCVLLGSKRATMDSAKMPTCMRSEVCKGQVSAHSTRSNRSVTSSSFSIVNPPYLTQSA